MPKGKPNDAVMRVEASARVHAEPQDVYRAIADYKSGHPNIVPPKYFRNMEVEQGGYGAGTVIRFEMTGFGWSRQCRASVAEPEPGRLLVETDEESGAVTTFVVEPAGEGASRVRISTELQLRKDGMLGWIERRANGSFLKKAYEAELDRIQEFVGKA